jgi:hypothetical protein
VAAAFPRVPSCFANWRPWAQIVQWERGRARLYPIELIKLCHALDVKPEWLLCWERRVH